MLPGNMRRNRPVTKLSAPVNREAFVMSFQRHVRDGLPRLSRAANWHRTAAPLPDGPALPLYVCAFESLYGDHAYP